MSKVAVNYTRILQKQLEGKGGVVVTAIHTGCVLGMCHVFYRITRTTTLPSQCLLLMLTLCWAAGPLGGI